MKKRLLSVLLAALIIVSLLPTAVLAANKAENGLSVSQTTDKESYLSGEYIITTLTVTNTNEHESDVLDLELTNYAPKGYSVATGYSTAKEVETLKAGETVSLETKFAMKRSSPATGDDGIGKILLLSGIALLSAALLVWLIPSKMLRKNRTMILICCLMAGVVSLTAGVNAYEDNGKSGRISLSGVVSVGQKELSVDSAVSYGERTAEKYLVTFAGNYDGSAYKQTVKETSGAKYLLPKTAPTREGYSFAGWFTDVTAGTEITAESTVTITAPQTLYAHWTANRYAVTVQVQGDHGTAKAQVGGADVTSAAPGATVTLAATPKEGYQLKEWKVVSGGVTVTENKFTMPASNVTVQAVFEEIPETKTVADILPGGFPTSLDTGWKNQTYENESVKLYKHDASTLMVRFDRGGMTIDTSVKLTSKGKDYTCSVDGITWTFNMNEGALASVTISDAGVTAFNGIYMPVVSVASVSIEPSSIELPVSEYYTVKATVLPENATNKNVTWSSDKPEVATVDATGKVTAVAAGTATITVTTVDGSKTATCTVTVKAAAPATPTFKAVAVENGKVIINEGEEDEAEVDAYDLTFYYDALDHSSEGIVYDPVYTAPAEENPKNKALRAAWGYNDVREQIKSVKIDESMKGYHGLTSTAYMLYNFENAESIIGTENLDVSNVTSMKSMFNDYGHDVENFNSIPNLSGWNTAKVTNMSDMFSSYGYSSTVLNVVPNVSDFNTSNVTDMSDMFSIYGYSSTVLNVVPNVSGFDTAKVTDMNGMFYEYGYESKTLNAVPDVSKFITNQVTDMHEMFSTYGCASTALSSVPNVSDWNTEKVTNMSNMFNSYGYSSETLNFTLDLSEWSVGSIDSSDYESMFDYAGASTATWSVTIPAKTGEKANDTTHWYIGDGTDTSKYIAPASGRQFTLAKTVADILPEDFPTTGETAWKNDGMGTCYIKDENLYFYSVKPYINLPLTTEVSGSGDSFTCSDSNVTFTFKMTEGKLTSIKVEKSVGLDGTYAPVAVPTFKAVYNTTNDANTLTFYYDAVDHSGTNITVYEDGTENYLFDNEKTKGVKWGYNGVRNAVKSVVIDESVKDYAGLTSTAYMFGGNSTTYSMVNATNITGVEYLNVSKVTDMSYMFYCFGRVAEALTTVPDVSNWDTSNVTNMQSMFQDYGCKSTALKDAPAVSKWNTSNVTNMQSMFHGYGNTALKDAPAVSEWNTSKVTNMSDMFGCYSNNSTALKDAPAVSKWITSNVADMSNMFYNYGSSSTALNDIPAVSKWITSNVTNMNSMFKGYGNSSNNLNFTLDLSGWSVAEVTNYGSMFSRAGKSAPTWSVTIPAKTGDQANDTTHWYVGDGDDTEKYIKPADDRQFTLAKTVADILNTVEFPTSNDINTPPANAWTNDNSIKCYIAVDEDGDSGLQFVKKDDEGKWEWFHSIGLNNKVVKNENGYCRQKDAENVQLNIDNDGRLSSIVLTGENFSNLGTDGISIEGTYAPVAPSACSNTNDLYQIMYATILESYRGYDYQVYSYNENEFIRTGGGWDTLNDQASGDPLEVNKWYHLDNGVMIECTDPEQHGAYSILEVFQVINTAVPFSELNWKHSTCEYTCTCPVNELIFTGAAQDCSIAYDIPLKKVKGNWLYDDNEVTITFVMTSKVLTEIQVASKETGGLNAWSMYNGTYAPAPEVEKATVTIHVTYKGEAVSGDTIKFNGNNMELTAVTDENGLAVFSDIPTGKSYYAASEGSGGYAGGVSCEVSKEAKEQQFELQVTLMGE